MSIKDRITAVRERFGFLDHLLRTQEHVGAVKANQQAGAITYFGFISVFPILALAFAVVGFAARYVEGADQALVDAIGGIFPDLVVKPEPGQELESTQIDVAVFEQGAPGIASVGLLLVLYSGLGWLSAMRNALLVVFELPSDEQPNFVLGKLRDLMSLALIGVTMLLTVAVSAGVSAASEKVLEWLSLGEQMAWLIALLSIALGLAANTVLYFWIFRLLARPPLPSVSLWKGAFLGAIGFEILKQVAGRLLGATAERPATAVFGVALVLVVWIFYFARILMYGAAFAHTAPAAVAQREAHAAALAEADAAELADRVDARAAVLAREEARGRSLAPFAAGTLAAAGFAGLLKKARSGSRSRSKWE